MKFARLILVGMLAVAAFSASATPPPIIQFGSNVSLPPINPFPTSIVGSGTYVTGIQPLAGAGITLCATSSQNGTLSIQRYADIAGTIAIGAAISQSTTGTTAACVAVNDGLPALYFQGSIVNGSGSATTISGTALIISGVFP